MKELKGVPTAVSLLHVYQFIINVLLLKIFLFVMVKRVVSKWLMMVGESVSRIPKIV